jgi:acyl-CoA dehydrogenase
MKSIGMAKAVVPVTLGKILDAAMQLHGAEGICQDTFLPRAFAGARTLRWADGPDEVHLLQIGITELKRAYVLLALCSPGSC